MLSSEVLRFIRGTVSSVWTLELLLLVRREADREWTVESLTHELRSSVAIVSDVLLRLGSAGIVEERDGVYRYHPASAEIEAVITALAQSYAEFPFAVTQEIFAAPNDKIRLFADAFRLNRGRSE